MRLVCMILLGCFVSGCGFHLRGTHQPKTLRIKEVVLLPYDPYTIFYQTMREKFKRSGVDVLLPQTNLACPTINVIKSELTKHTLVYSIQGQTRRERLQLTLSYDLTLPNTNQHFTQKMTANRDLQLNPNQDLADQYEKTLLEKEMQQELIDQLIQQLAFLPLTESYQCVSISTNSKP
jgi:outer membrane lipopolysaccharide assembly protein LptE/RlpB